MRGISCATCCGAIYIVFGIFFLIVGLSLDAITACVARYYLYGDGADTLNGISKRSAPAFSEYLIGAQGMLQLHYFTLPENVEIDFSKGNALQSVVNENDDRPTESFDGEHNLNFSQISPLQITFTILQDSVMLQKKSDFSMKYRNVDIFKWAVQKHMLGFSDKFFKILTNDSDFQGMIDVLRGNLLKTLTQSNGNAFGPTSLSESAKVVANFLKIAKSEIKIDSRNLENVEQILTFILNENSLLIDSNGNLKASNLTFELYPLPLYTSISGLGIAPERYALPGYPGLQFVQNKSEDVGPNYGTVAYKSLFFWWNLLRKNNYAETQRTEDFLKKYDLFLSSPFWTDSYVSELPYHQEGHVQYVKSEGYADHEKDDYWSAIVAQIWNIVLYEGEQSNVENVEKRQTVNSRQDLVSDHNNDSKRDEQKQSDLQNVNVTEENVILTLQKLHINDETRQIPVMNNKSVPSYTANPSSGGSLSRTLKLNVRNMTGCPEMRSHNPNVRNMAGSQERKSQDLNIRKVTGCPEMRRSQDPSRASITFAPHCPDPTRILLLPAINLPVNGTIALQINIRIPLDDNYGALQGRTLPLLSLDLTVLRLPSKVNSLLRDALALRAGLVILLPSIGIMFFLIGIGVILFRTERGP